MSRNHPSNHDPTTRSANVDRPANIPPARVGGSPERIGPYRILETIGEGGMGVVYLAEQREPVKRQVALKIIKQGMDSKEVVARFEAERQALALMDHPNIAKVLDAGTTEQGRPFFVMEHVRGERITDYCDKHRLTTNERLSLLAKVCRAIQHAHQKGVIHRDIKPSNVLVTIPDDTPIPKVIDFGVAKATGHRLTEKTMFTEQGQLIGTPEYMSPEQAEMTGLNVDTRTDIYSLGVLLYELLTGSLPFEPSTLRRAGLQGIQKTIREVEPPRPSTRISQLENGAARAADHRRTSVYALRRLLRGELDWVTMRALEKDRARRYQSASEFAADIERYLSGDPVAAGPPSATYRLRKLVRKHRGPVAAGIAVVVASLVFGTAALWQKGIAEQQRRIADERARRANANAALAYASTTVDPLLKAMLVLEVPNLVSPSERMHVARQAASSPLPRLVYRGHERKNLNGGFSVAYSPNGQKIATFADDGLTQVWPASGIGDPVILGKLHKTNSGQGAFSPDGKLIAIVEDSAVLVWPEDGVGEPIVLRGHRNMVTALAFSPDGKTLATTSIDSTARLWPADGSGEPIVLSDHDGRVYNVAFSPDGSRIVTASQDNTARVWRLDGVGEPIVLRHEGQVLTAVFSPDGSKIVTASWQDHAVRVWEADGTGEPVHLRGHEDLVWQAWFSPDGRRVVSVSYDKTARVWMADGTGEPVVLRHPASVLSVQFTLDGRQVITGCQDGAVRLWAADGTGDPVVLGGIGAQVLSLALSPDGSTLAGGSEDGILRVWPMRTDTEPVIIAAGDGVADVAFSPDGTRIATASLDGGIRIWGTDGAGEPILVQRWESALNGIAFSPDGSMLACTSVDKTVRVCRTDGTGEPRVFEGHKNRIRKVSFSPDGRRFVTASWDKTVRVWEADGSREPVVLAGHGDRVNRAAFSPDGNRIVSASNDSTARVWAADGAGQPIVLMGHEGWVFDARFSPDGTRIVTASNDQTVRLWDADSGQEVRVFEGHENWVATAAFSPDGAQIVSASTDGTLRIWAVDGSQEPIVMRGHTGPVYGATFSPDGSKIVSFSQDGTLRVWGRLTWDSLSELLREKTMTCLIPEERMKFLGETPEEAWARYSKCERQYRRTPMASFHPK